MKWSKAILVSIMLHFGLMGGFLLSRLMNASPKPLVYVQAELFWAKGARDPKLMPKKYVGPREELSKNQKPKILKAEALDKAPKKPEVKTAQIHDKQPSSDSSVGPSFSQSLKKLSETWAEEEAYANNEALASLSESENTFLNQVYTLIKSGFIVPEDLNGPSGNDLHVVIRLRLDHLGNLQKVELLEPSGNQHFDKVVLDGTNRIQNFGEPPSELLGSLLKEGITVELCPVSCSS